jgi:hypothetical protein
MAFGKVTWRIAPSWTIRWQKRTECCKERCGRFKARESGAVAARSGNYAVEVFRDFVLRQGRSGFYGTDQGGRAIGCGFPATISFSRLVTAEDPRKTPLFSLFTPVPVWMDTATPARKTPGSTALLPLATRARPVHGGDNRPTSSFRHSELFDHLEHGPSRLVDGKPSATAGLDAVY